MILTNI